MAQRWIAKGPGGPETFELVEEEVRAPGHGEVAIAVRAAGVNPADYKHAASGAPADFPKPVGYEVSGVITAVGPGTELPFAEDPVGAEVVAFRVRGGWATDLVVPATDVFAKPPSMSFEEAANLLLAGATAAEMLHRVGASAGETVLVHGASGAVGVSILQQAAMLGVRVVGTAGQSSFTRVERYGGVPVQYGDGLLERVADAAPEGVAAALDCVGTEEAVTTSLALVADRDRILTIVAGEPTLRAGLRTIRGSMPESAAYRDSVRGRLLSWAAQGRLEVPLARTFPLSEALAAVALVRGGHPGGKVALVPDAR